MKFLIHFSQKLEEFRLPEFLSLIDHFGVEGLKYEKYKCCFTFLIEIVTAMNIHFLLLSYLMKMV